MKKHIRKVIAFIMSTVLVISCSCVISSAEEKELRATCVEDHFNMIGTTNNDAPPSVYSCPYTALSMILSFYDSYWHEGFVPEYFEWDQGIYDSSTDTLIHTFCASTETTAWNSYKNSDESNYREFVNETYDSAHHLESYLISLAREIGLCDNEDTQFGLTSYEVVVFLEYYLHEICELTDDQVTVHIYNQFLNGGDDALFDTMITQISNGFPVIYAGCSVDLFGFDLKSTIFDYDGGHALIAYSAVNSNGNISDIMLNTGWATSIKQTVNTTDYSFWNDIIWLEINEENLPHECTNAYYDVNKKHDVCACYVYYNTHPAHQSHNYQFDGCDSEAHFDKCYCGIGINREYHTMSYSYYTPIQHYERCSKCTYSGAVTHDYSIPTSPTETYHGLKCACGVLGSATEEHYEYSYTSQGALLHNVYCECGYFIGTSTHSMRIVGKNNQCIHCGYVRSGLDLPGQLMSHEEDEEPGITE